jgi:hypothetical protein
MCWVLLSPHTSKFQWWARPSMVHYPVMCVEAGRDKNRMSAPDHVTGKGHAKRSRTEVIGRGHRIVAPLCTTCETG